jgi:hypothetical protein
MHVLRGHGYFEKNDPSSYIIMTRINQEEILHLNFSEGTRVVSGCEMPISSRGKILTYFIYQ